MVADYEHDVKNSENEMADPIWWTSMGQNSSSVPAYKFLSPIPLKVGEIIVLVNLF